MQKTKIDFKNVLAGIGLGFLVLFLVATLAIKVSPDSELSALLTGGKINSLVKDNLGGF